MLVLLNHPKVWLYICGALFLASLTVSAYSFLPFGHYVAHQDAGGDVLLFFLSWAILGSGAVFFRALAACSQGELSNILKRDIVLLTCVVWAITLFTLPTKSQDLYHGLTLARDFLLNGSNPYLISPESIPDQSWSRYVYTWRDLPVVYGPFWVYVLAALSKLGGSLVGAVLLTKAFLLGVFVATLFLLRKLFQERQLSDSKIWLLLATFALNPLMLQQVLVDAHNDIIIGLSVLVAYYLAQKRAFAAAVFCVGVGALFKYVTLLLLPLLFARFVIAKPARREVLLMLLSVGSLTIIWFIVFIPFGGLQPAVSALAREVSERGARDFATFTSIITSGYLGVSLSTTKLVGAFIAILAGLAYLKKQSPFSFALPLLVLLLLATPWFQPWYLLWVIPVLMLQIPYWLLLTVTLSASLLSPNYLFNVGEWSLLIVIVIVAYYVVLPIRGVQRVAVAVRDFFSGEQTMPSKKGQLRS